MNKVTGLDPTTINKVKQNMTLWEVAMHFSTTGSDFPGRIRKAGRPANTEVDGFAAQLWIAAVGQSLNASNPNQIEHMLLQRNTIHTHTRVNTILSGKFYNYYDGLNKPGTALANEVEIVCSGTKKYLHLPLYVAISKNLNSIKELHAALSLLRPEITDLFYPLASDTFNHSHQLRYRELELLDVLNKESDIDALTACIGTLREKQHYERNFYSSFIHGDGFLHTFLSIYFRVFSQLPYHAIAQNMFDYLVSNFFNFPVLHLRYPEPYYYLNIQNIDIEPILEDSRSRLLIIKELEVLKQLGHSSTPLSCLYLAEQYLKPMLLREYLPYVHSNDLKGLKRQEPIKRLTRALRRWEQRQLRRLHLSKENNQPRWVEVSRLPRQYQQNAGQP